MLVALWLRPLDRFCRRLRKLSFIRTHFPTSPEGWLGHPSITETRDFSKTLDLRLLFFLTVVRAL